ncbi:MAG: hypothetical protein V1913_05760 [Fibrobacterota bacterium]
MKQRVLIAAFLILAALAYPTSMFVVGLPELSTASEVIVQAKVTAIVPQFNRDSTQIVTYIRMNINDDLLGDKEDNEIIIRQPGGTLGSKMMAVEGTTTYRVGDNNVLFLRRDLENNSTFQTLGLYQGKYRIFTDASNVQRVAQEVNGKVILYKSAAGTGPVETGNNLPLNEFKTKVLSYRTGQ